MKKLLFLSALFVAFILAASFTLCSCSLDGGVTSAGSAKSSEETSGSSEERKVENWKFTADNLKDAKDIYKDFFFLSVFEDNLTVTVSNDEGVMLAETIDGYSDHVVYSEEYELTAYKDGDQYFVAVEDGDNKYFFVGEEAYDEHILAFVFYLDLLSDLDEDTTIHLTSEGTSTPVEYDYIIDATLTLELVLDNITISATAVKENDLVTKFTSVMTDEDGAYTVEVTFDYGNASVDIPDITGWFDTSAPRSASEWYVSGTVGGDHYDDLPMYFDYVTGCFKTDYVEIELGDNFTVKNKNDDAVAYGETVDEEFLTGHQMIVFDPHTETVAFESEEDPSEAEGHGSSEVIEVWTVVGEFDGIDRWNDDLIMGLRENGTYCSDTIELHNGDKLRVRKDCKNDEYYPNGENEYYIVSIEKTAQYFVIFDPETHQITLEYDTMGNLDPSKIDWGELIGGGGND